MTRDEMQIEALAAAWYGRQNGHVIRDCADGSVVQRIDADWSTAPIADVDHYRANARHALSVLAEKGLLA